MLDGLKEWRDKTITTPKDAYLAGLTTGLKHSRVRGPRFVIVHAGGKMDLLTMRN
jgi:hypothetical protein